MHRFPAERSRKPLNCDKATRFRAFRITFVSIASPRPARISGFLSSLTLTIFPASLIPKGMALSAYLLALHIRCATDAGTACGRRRASSQEGECGTFTA
jgi:hypothetical protein